jgi:hypothetical protein
MRIIDPIALALLTSLTLFAASACTDSSESGEVTRASDLPVQTVTLDITLPAATDHAEIEAIARSAEALAGTDVAGVKLEVEKHGDSETILSVTMWGPELDSADVIVKKLRAEHPALADVTIGVDVQAGPPADEPLAAEHDEDETPEQTKARVVKQLRDQGVEGAINVDVVDDEAGRRVEVRVEDSNHAPN